MYVSVALSPRTLEGRLPSSRCRPVQTGPDSRSVAVIGEERKVSAKLLVVAPPRPGLRGHHRRGPRARVVVEGAQNLRPGSLVSVGEPPRRVKGRAGKSGRNGAPTAARPVDAGRRKR
ncbi:MAG: hypothetical protein IPL06_16810 [Betaproteobacteria bacterium]|nr:hypothetical protein [Betaproteobacteria bacterium]